MSAKTWLQAWRAKRRVHRCTRLGSSVYCTCKGEAQCSANPHYRAK